MAAWGGLATGAAELEQPSGRDALLFCCNKKLPQLNKTKPALARTNAIMVDELAYKAAAK